MRPGSMIAAMLRLSLAASRRILICLPLALATATAVGAQAPPAPAPAPAPAVPAPATDPVAPAPAPNLVPIAFSCPERGAFGSGAPFFSQIYEDYILSYVFRDVAKGSYVDVGAYDPDALSVTKHFYRRGWRGVNIEPNPDLLAAFQKARPDDVNMGVGISDAAATLTFFKFDSRSSGLSTFDPSIAWRHRHAGHVYHELTIPVVTLTEALDKSGTVKGAFELLNIDVEGFERKVLAGLDVAKYPPKVIALEANAPLSEERTQHKWEDLLFGRGYSFALDDGLNRYYVQRSERELRARFLEIAYCVARDKLAKGLKLDGYLPEPVK
jgi:FkbM family methyltransferase